MNIAFPNHFTIRSAAGNMLQMQRLFRFRHLDDDLNFQDYIAAMETKYAPFDNIDMLDVFRIDPITLAPLWVNPDEEAFQVARCRFERYRNAAFFINQYTSRLEKLYGKDILPYMQDLEMNLLREFDARQIALNLSSQFERKKKALKSLESALCRLDKCEKMAQAARSLVFTLWGQIDGLDAANRMLADIDIKFDLVKGLEQLYRLEAPKNRHILLQIKPYLYDTFWAQVCYAEDVRNAVAAFFARADLIDNLRALYGKSGLLSEEKIQALWFDPAWKIRYKHYRQMPTKETEEENKQ